jgi:hypothetical protein
MLTRGEIMALELGRRSAHAGQRAAREGGFEPGVRVRAKASAFASRSAGARTRGGRGAWASTRARKW